MAGLFLCVARSFWLAVSGSQFLDRSSFRLRVLPTQMVWIVMLMARSGTTLRPLLAGLANPGGLSAWWHLLAGFASPGGLSAWTSSSSLSSWTSSSSNVFLVHSLVRIRLLLVPLADGLVRAASLLCFGSGLASSQFVWPFICWKSSRAAVTSLWVGIVSSVSGTACPLLPCSAWVFFMFWNLLWVRIVSISL